VDAPLQRQAEVAFTDTPRQAAQLRTRDSLQNGLRQKVQRQRLDALGRVSPEAGTSSNADGLPASLKSGIESLSGISMDTVRVHYNSAKPAQLNSHAYAQGTDIHLAPGQEKHLPHEAWHVVQQAQGRVRPTMQMKAGVAINDGTSLEREADAMGARAMRASGVRDGRQGGAGSASDTRPAPSSLRAGSAGGPVQRKEQRAEVVWAVTHLVKDQGGSLFGDDWQSGELDVEEGELVEGQVITVDDEEVYMSRRGPNQENSDRRQEDARGLKQYKWLQVLAVGGREIGGGVYVRAETIRIHRGPPSRVSHDVEEGTAPDLFEGLSGINEAWKGAKDKRRRSIGLKVINEVDEEQGLSSGWNWDQFDEGVNVSGDMMEEDYRKPISESQKQWTLRAMYENEPGIPIAYMILEERNDESGEHLYLRWLIAHPNKGGGGGELMKAAKEILQKGNYTEVRVESAYSAVSWYQSMGFEIIEPGKVIKGVGYGDTTLSLKK